MSGDRSSGWSVVERRAEEDGCLLASHIAAPRGSLQNTLWFMRAVMSVSSLQYADPKGVGSKVR